MFAIDIGFLPIRLLDIIDILVVGYIIYRLYRLLKGTIAFNIFIGLVSLFSMWWLVEVLEMQLLTVFLGQFVSVGVILVIIIFQPEVRRFLLLLGDTTLKQRAKFLSGLFKTEKSETKYLSDQTTIYIKRALEHFRNTKTGALMIFAEGVDTELLETNGILLNAKLSDELLISIFHKESPLHDGAVIVNNNQIRAAKCILPVSESTWIPGHLGLRHRAAIGVSEQLNVPVLVVSEESGTISLVNNGTISLELTPDLAVNELGEKLKKNND